MSETSGRPQTLRDVSLRVLAGKQSFDPAVREFVDEFNAHPDRRQDSIDAEPNLIDDIKDAYLATVAEYLASVYRLVTPGWVDGHGRPLRSAFFSGGLESLKAILTVESPAAFRRRLLFVGKDALDRPHSQAGLSGCGAFCALPGTTPTLPPPGHDRTAGPGSVPPGPARPTPAVPRATATAARDRFAVPNRAPTPPPGNPRR